MPTKTSFFESCLGVFQGGGCRGAAFAGAITEASARGVNFVGLAGTSAGSIVASMLAAGASPSQLTQILNELDFKSLILPPDLPPKKSGLGSKITAAVANHLANGAGDFLTYRGSHSSKEIDTWVNSKLKLLLPHISDKRIKFEHLPKPVWIVAANVSKREVEVWSQDTTPGSDVAYAVRCSCSIPFFFQAVDDKYVDGAVLSNLPAFVFANKRHSVYARRILAFTLVSDTTPNTEPTPMNFALSIINTAIDGASALQSKLVAEIHEIQIGTGEIMSTDFDKMNAEIVANLVKSGSQAAKTFFDNEHSRVKPTEAGEILCDGDDEVYSVLTETMVNHNSREVVVCMDRAAFAYPLFPTLFKWRTRQVAIKVFLRTQPANVHDSYQRRLLESLGAQVFTRETLPFQGFLIDPTHHDNAQAVIYLEDPPNQRTVAVHYRSRNDRSAIGALYSQLDVPGNAPETGRLPTLVRSEENYLVSQLAQHVSQYARASMSMETIPLEQLDSLCQLVRGFKFHQVRMLYEMFTQAGITPFDCAAVDYGNGKTTIATPPVVEESGGRFILVQGTTRAVYCHRLGVKNLRCLVVRGASTALPVDNRIPLSNVLVAGRFVSTVDRYGSQIDREYRRIEYATHVPSETLI